MVDYFYNRADEEITEIIVKYSGDLAAEVSSIGGNTEILSENFAIVTIPTEQIEALYLLPSTEYLEIPKRLYFMRFSSQQSACLYDAVLEGRGLDGRGVIIGIIDSGIDIYNRDFIDENGSTRILGILDLSVTENGARGRRYTREEINSAIKQESFISFADTEGHGTAVAGICAGGGGGSGQTGIAPGAELVIVKLGLRDGYARSTDIMRGLKYIRDTALSLNMPAAINISYGTNDGPHDGSSLVELYINEVADNTVCSVCIAAGNEGAAGHHYSGSFESGETIRFNVGGNIRNMYMSLWKSFSDNIGITLTAPNGQKSGMITSTSRINFADTIVNILFSLPSPYNIDTEVYINFENSADIQSGIWTLEFEPISIVNGNFDIWLPVTEAVGSDTFFLDSAAYTTITLPASAYKAIAVGGYNQNTDTVLDFSGRGYTRNTGYIKPDIAAPAYNVPSSALNGGTDLFTGTSYAAPHVTGAAALMLQWGVVQGRDLFMYGERLKAFLLKGASRNIDAVYPNRALGYGTLCFENTLRLMEQSIPSVSIQQAEGRTSVEEAAYSGEYMDFVKRRGALIYDDINNDNIITCPLDDDFDILYIKSEYYMLNRMEFINTIGVKPPFVMGLMQYEAAFDKSGITTVRNQPYLGLRGSGMLVAVIDTGIDYRSENFIYEDGTSKILYIWDQTSGDGTDELCFGTEYDNDYINRALSGEAELDTRDEIGHGTYLAEIAAGRNGAAPDAELIIVKLKQAKQYLKEEMFVGEDVPAYSSIDLMLGVSYAYKKANELDRPVVICIGTGTNQGGHSSQSILEEHFSNIARQYGVCLCVPSGNEGIARHHTSFDFSQGEVYRDIEITVGENEAGFNVDIWNSIVDLIAVEIISPLGESVLRLQPIINYENTFTLSKGGGRVRVSYYISEDSASDQHTNIRVERPAFGIWLIRIYNNNMTTGAVHMWLPISAFIGRNTFFITSNPMVTVTTPGTAYSVMTVGGYNSTDNSTFAPTGRGPTRFYVLRPDFCAPAVNLGGRSGTSYACAVAAGAAALMLEWLVLRQGVYTANTVMVTAYLILGAQAPANEILPNNIWGYGILDLYAGFENL